MSDPFSSPFYRNYYYSLFVRTGHEETIKIPRLTTPNYLDIYAYVHSAKLKSLEEDDVQ